MTRSHLESIECSAQPLDLAFHPQREHLVAAALVDGTVECHDCLSHRYSHAASNEEEEDEHDTIVSSIPVMMQQQQRKSDTKTSCRVALFSNTDASHIYAGTSVGDVVVLDAERACTLTACTTSLEASSCVQSRLSNGTNGIHALHQLPPELGNLLATGNDEGCVSLWDVRSALRNKPVVTWKKHDDYISDFDNRDHTLLASCSDCSLSVMDIRMVIEDRSKKHEAVRKSDDQEDELLSVQIIKNGKKVVCGTQEGVLAVWSWGTWGDVSDRFPGHPASIDALLKVDEDTLLTGSSDGLVRLVQIHPDKLLGVMGDHDGYPIEKLKFNSTRSFVGSVSHDALIRLWDARVLQDDVDENDDDEGGANEKDTDEQVKSVASMPSAGPRRGSDDELDSADDEDCQKGSDSSDCTSDDDDEEDDVHRKNPKRLRTENEKFFEDL